MSLTIDTAYAHGRVVGKMVNYGFGMPTRLVADGDVARWCGRLVAHYAGAKALVVLGGDKHTRDELVSAALGSLARALLERVLFRCGSFEGDGGRRTGRRSRGPGDRRRRGLCPGDWRARCLLSWAPARFPFLPLSRPNCWRASGLLCVSCSVASAPWPNICHKGMGYFWLVKRLTCQNKPVSF